MVMVVTFVLYQYNWLLLFGVCFTVVVFQLISTHPHRKEKSFVAKCPGAWVDISPPRFS